MKHCEPECGLCESSYLNFSLFHFITAHDTLGIPGCTMHQNAWVMLFWQKDN